MNINNFVWYTLMAMRLMSHYHNLYFKIFLIFYLKEFELFNKENYKILKIMYIIIG